MLALRRILKLVPIISAVGGATIVGPGLPVPAVIVDARPAQQPVERSVQDDEPRWGRAEVNAGLGRFPPIRSDWSDSPALWELRAAADVLEIPREIRSVLQQLD